MKEALFSIVLLMLFGMWVPAAQSEEAKLPLEHKPFLAWIKAIKESNIEIFKAVYSKNMQKSIARKGWKETLAKYKKNFDQQFRDYRPKDFTITFQPFGKNKGILLIKFKGKDLPDLDITKEEDEWKINEN